MHKSISKKRREASEVEKQLKKVRTPKQQELSENNKMLYINISMVFLLFFNIVFTLVDTVSGVYKTNLTIFLYWIWGILMILLMLYSHIRRNRHVMRLVYIIMIVRLLIPWYTYKDREKLNDMASVAFYIVYISHCCTAFMVCIGLSESTFIYSPISTIFPLFEVVGMIYVSLNFGGTPSTIEQVIKEKFMIVILLWLGLLLVQNTVVIIGGYLMNKNKLMMN